MSKAEDSNFDGQMFLNQSDIVTRLRKKLVMEALGDKATYLTLGDCLDAADEIERLRDDQAELLKALTGLYEACRWEKVAPEIDAAKAAIAKATGGE